MLAAGISCTYIAYDTAEQVKSNKIKIAKLEGSIENTSHSITMINDKLNAVGNEAYNRRESMEHSKKEISRSMERSFRCTITGYDLSVQSCGKSESHPAYGVTATGTDLSGHTLYSARAIAVDPNVIPLGSKVRIKFDNEHMSKYNGVYTAVDTGGAIRGNRIDLFFGDSGSGSVSQEALEFGVQTALVQII